MNHMRNIIISEEVLDKWKGEIIMNREFTGNVQKDQRAAKQNRMLWIQHAQRVVYFSQMEGFEIKEFSNQAELIDYAKACVSSGYHIG